jgi:CheY-like chemotaxis protein
MLKRVIGENIVLTRRLDSNVGQVKADPTQIDQVLMNLALNARDAMPQGGEILFETANVELSGEEILVDASEPPAAGRYVLLSVSDTGEGMDQETLTRIFEPFFTTKEPGKGTGLGLSTVYGIIKQSGGDIRAYSEPGTGSTFRIYLPRVDRQIAPAGGEREEQRRSPGGNETILLIEDNDMVRQVVRESLTRGGYAVIEAGCGAEGADLFERQAESIDLVLTDMVMPGMSGRDLAEKLRSIRPEVKVLFMSGFSSMKSRNGDIGETPGAFIKKPFTSMELLEKVRQMLTDEPEELPSVD